MDKFNFVSGLPASTQVLFKPSLVTDKDLIYGINEDAQQVFGDVTINGIVGNRDANGNPTIPWKYSAKEEPSYRKLPEAIPSQPKEASSWPPQNEDGSYQVAPGAKLTFDHPSDQKAQMAGKAIGAAIGAGIGVVAGGVPAVAGAVIGATADDVIGHIIKQGKYPHFEIDGRSSTSAMDAPDFPNGNREDG